MSTEQPSRPRDAALTRERILSEARHEFGRHGFAATTVRAVAARADVSPNLITRYFGGKEGLFVAATEVHLKLDSVLDVSRDSLGSRLAGSIVRRWSAQPGEDPLLALHRAAGEKPEAAEALSSFIDDESLEPLRRQFVRYGMSAADADARARAIDVFVLGVSTRHRVLRDDLGEIEDLESWMAQSIQRLVDAP